MPDPNLMLVLAFQLLADHLMVRVRVEDAFLLIVQRCFSFGQHKRLSGCYTLLSELKNVHLLRDWENPRKERKT